MAAPDVPTHARPTPAAEHPFDPPARLSACVMAHPARQAAAQRLAMALSDLDAGMVTDPDPGRPGGPLRTSRMAWSRVAPGATHHLVVQDDSVLTPDFVRHALAGTRALPGHALGLFTEWGSFTSYALRVAALVGVDWVEVVDGYMPAQALILPADVAREFDRYAARATAGDEPDDEALLGFLRSTGVPMVVSVSNPVQHGDEVSIAGNGWHGLRKAACWPADPVAPGGTVLDRIALVPFFSWFTGDAICRFRDQPASDDWQQVPAIELLRAHGLGDDDVRRLIANGCPRRPGDAAVPAHLTQSLVTAAVAVGLLAGECGAPADGARTKEPVAAAALATLAPGGLRNFVDGHALPAVSEQLASVVDTAAQLGLETAERTSRSGRGLPAARHFSQ
ncbi:hypothetical protein [Micromonospora rubida]|uniref:hypothetical protein n=1 Tax=Micromonospora rubida TaxID=2697657 RepID=UPI001378E8DF|nr:hypothetical protein [Micromonospora rubida]NBE83256.1 hypothetical protein [Micromonospora rubida]